MPLLPGPWAPILDEARRYPSPHNSQPIMVRVTGGTRGSSSVVSLAVVDASVLAAFYAADDPRRVEVVTRLAAGNALFAPAHLDAEVVSALRGLARINPALERAVPHALAHLAGFPIRRMPLPPLLERMWALRHNVKAWDAAYVALAERLGSPLMTCDAKLVAAAGPTCTFDLIS